MVGFSCVEDLGFYLGFPILHSRVSVNTFEFIINKVRQKHTGWQVSKLSMAGCITLVRSVLLMIPNYFMFTVRIPISVCNEIERLAHNFIWGSTSEVRKASLMSW